MSSSVLHWVKCAVFVSTVSCVLLYATLSSTHGVPLVPTRRERLHAYFEARVERHVAVNQWELGCADEVWLAPVLRATHDRLSAIARVSKLAAPLPGRTLVDAGANDGQEAGVLLGAFMGTSGMCQSLRTPETKNFAAFRVVSIEASPSVFCRLARRAEDSGWQAPRFYAFNVALSDVRGGVDFEDTGTEGGTVTGKLAGSSAAFMDVYESSQRCDGSGIAASTVSLRAFSLDEVYAAFSERTGSGGLPCHQQIEGSCIKPIDDIFCLKIDTEGSDLQVLRGAVGLLRQRRVTFVVFEVSTEIRRITHLMSSMGYICFILSPLELWPVSPPVNDSARAVWWYTKLDTLGSWWGNCVCGVHGSVELRILWRMYHSTDEGGYHEVDTPGDTRRMQMQPRISDQFDLL